MFPESGNTCPLFTPQHPMLLIFGQMCRLMFLSNGIGALNKISLPPAQACFNWVPCQFYQTVRYRHFRWFSFFLFLFFFFLFIALRSVSLLRNRLADGSLVTLFNGACGVILKGRLVIGSIIQTRDFDFPLFFQSKVGFWR